MSFLKTCKFKRDKDFNSEEAANRAYSKEIENDETGLLSRAQGDIANVAATPAAVMSSAMALKNVLSGKQGLQTFVAENRLSAATFSGTPSDNISASETRAAGVLQALRDDYASGDPARVKQAEEGLISLVADLNQGKLGRYDPNLYPTLQEWEQSREKFFGLIRDGLSPSKAYYQTFGKMAMGRGTRLFESVVEQQMKAGAVMPHDMRRPMPTIALMSTKHEWEDLAKKTKDENPPNGIFRINPDNSIEFAPSEKVSLNYSTAEAHQASLSEAKKAAKVDAQGRTVMHFHYPAKNMAAFFDAVDEGVKQHVQRLQEESSSKFLAGNASKVAMAARNPLANFMHDEGNAGMKQAQESLSLAAQALAKSESDDAFHAGAGFLGNAVNSVTETVRGVGAAVGMTEAPTPGVFVSDLADGVKTAEGFVVGRDNKKERAKSNAKFLEAANSARRLPAFAIVSIGNVSTDQSKFATSGPFITGDYTDSLQERLGDVALARGQETQLRQAANDYFSKAVGGSVNLDGTPGRGFVIRPFRSNDSYQEFTFRPEKVAKHYDSDDSDDEGHHHSGGHYHGKGKGKGKKKGHWKGEGKGHWKGGCAAPPAKSESEYKHWGRNMPAEGKAWARNMPAQGAMSQPKYEVDLSGDYTHQNYTYGHQLVVTAKDGLNLINPHDLKQMFVPQNGRLIVGKKFMFTPDHEHFDVLTFSTFRPGHVDTDQASINSNEQFSFRDPATGHQGLMLTADAFGEKRSMSESEDLYRRAHVAAAFFA